MQEKIRKIIGVVARNRIRVLALKGFGGVARKGICVVAGAAIGILVCANSVVHAQNFSQLLQTEKANAPQGAAQNIDSEAMNQLAPAPGAGLEAIAGPEAVMGTVVVGAGTVPLNVASDAASFDDSKYTLGVNDVIEIMVARHPEVSKAYLINSEGKIQYEFVGDVEIAGLTKKEANDVLAARLATYIVNPEVTVKIVGYNSKVVYIIGEVASPGKIYMRGDTITIREALLQAGLPLLSASTRKCRLITPADNGQAVQKYVDVFKLIYEGDLRENLVMKPGDTLYIPATVMAKAMRVISPVTQPVVAAGSAARPVMTGGF